MVDYQLTNAQIISILHVHAPRAEDSQRLNDMIRGIKESHGDDSKAVLLILTGMLYDGLAYGNWPWTTYSHIR